MRKIKTTVLDSWSKNEKIIKAHKKTKKNEEKWAILVSKNTWSETQSKNNSNLCLGTLKTKWKIGKIKNKWKTGTYYHTAGYTTMMLLET